LLRANPSVTGSRIATIAVLFIHALKNAETTENERIAQRTLPDKRSRRIRPMWSIAPERSNAPPITNKAAIVSGASFLKTSVIFPGSTSPSATTRHRIESASTSGAAHSRMKATSVRPITSSVRKISSVMGCHPPPAGAASMHRPNPFGKTAIQCLVFHV